MRVYHVVELPELRVEDEHLLRQVREAWVEGVAERFPELERVLTTLRETLVPRSRVGYATRLWCAEDVPLDLLHGFALDLSRVYGTAVLIAPVPEGAQGGCPVEDIDDLGSWVYVGGMLHDELALDLGG